jgi:hypothetical protein
MMEDAFPEDHGAQVVGVCQPCQIPYSHYQIVATSPSRNRISDDRSTRRSIHIRTLDR